MRNIKSSTVTSFDSGYIGRSATKSIGTGWMARGRENKEATRNSRKRRKQRSPKSKGKLKRKRERRKQIRKKSRRKKQKARESKRI
jgi:hypothetical protein